MDATQSIHALKPNLSQLLMRTFEQLEDPKYATVPQTHWHEFRPSILSKYHIEGGEEHDVKSDEGKASKDDDWQHVCKDCLSKTTTTVASSTQKCTSKCSSKPLSFRTFNWKMKPLWRYCASAVHMQYENGTGGKAKRQAAHKTIEGAQISASKCVQDFKIDLHQVQEKQAKWRSQSSEHLEKSKHSLSIHSQYSMPAFEVLPPLFENCTHSLLYQNSYLLDGVKYDYAATKSQQQSAKLYLNYMKFLKSVNRPTYKPTDCDIVFGEAKVVMNPSPHWEGARIQWLLNLERKQELRKLQTLEEEQQLSEKRKAIDLARMEAKLKRKALKNARGKNKPPTDRSEPAVKLCDDCQIKQRKGFFLKIFKKSADCRKTPKVELLPTL